MYIVVAFVSPENLYSNLRQTPANPWINYRECLLVLKGHTSTVRCVKFIDKYRVVSGSRDSKLRIWDLRAGACTAILEGHTRSIRNLAVTGNVIVSGSYDTTARVWSLDEGRCLKVLTGHSKDIYSVVADGKRVFTGSLDTSIRVWDIQTG